MNATEIENALDELWDFDENRCHILMAIARNKENETTPSTEPNIRKIIETTNEIREKLLQLNHAISRFDNTYRLYASVNARNVQKAHRVLQKDMIDWSHEASTTGEAVTQMKRVDHEWKSILQKPHSRDETRFLWDIDTTDNDKISQIEEELTEHIIMENPTPNGHHIITRPFNYTELSSFDEEHDKFYSADCELKKDDLMFVSYCRKI